MAMDLSASGKGKKRGARPEMNVTPLVDVVLVLLIIFMVVTPLLSKQFWVHLPTQPENPTQPAVPASHGPPPVVVSVDRAGVVRVNEEVVAIAALSRKIRRVLAARRDHAVFFDAADDAPFQQAVAALDAARGGGASTIAVMTESVVQR